MSQASVRYIADGSTDEFDVTFPFIDRNHVKVTVNGVPPILTPVWVGESRIKLNTLLVSGSVIDIRRETPLTSRLVDFTNGSVLTEEELDKAINQVFFVQQELKDLYDGTINTALINVATGSGYTSNLPLTEFLDELVAEIIARNATLTLQQAIADINLNAQTIINQANRIDGLQATVNALLDPDGSGLASAIYEERTQRIAGDTALAETLALIGAKNGAGTAWILDTNKVLVSPTESLANRLSAIYSRLDSADAAIVTEQNVRASADSAQATQFNSLLTRMTNAEAAIVTEQNARVSGDNAEATQRNALAARVTSAEAAIMSEQTARASGDSALASTLAILGAKNANGTAFVLDTSKVQVGGGVSLGTRLSGIDTNVANANAAIATEQTARAAGDDALAEQITSLVSRVSAAEAIISTEQTTRALGDTALSQTLALLGVKNGAGTGFILDLNKVQVSASETLGSRLSTIQTSLSGVSASITAEQTARANADSSLASQINTVTSNLNGVSNTVSTVQSSLNGVLGRYAVRIDQANNAVAGFELMGGSGISSTFRVLADKFELVTPGTGFKPFYVENGTTYIDIAAIKNLDLSTSKIGLGAITQITTFQNASFVPTPGGGFGGYLANNVDYVVCGGYFTKAVAESRLRIDVDATLWSDNDIAVQFFIRIRKSGEFWRQLIPNNTHPASYQSAKAGWAYGEMGTKYSDWAMLVVSDGTKDTVGQATKRLIVDGEAAGDYEIQFVVRKTAVAVDGNHLVMPGAVMTVEEIKR